jgi:prephenate dehydratase
MTSERALRVVIQGEKGAFSHQAALQALGEGIEVLPRPAFEDLFTSVLEGQADRALVPIENSLAGSIHENYDRLRARPLHIVAETQLRIRHCLIGRPGSSLASIRRVSSHPVALAQCRDFFAKHPNIEPMAAYDTAGSVMDLLRSDGPATQGAIASRLAAELYGGKILLEGLEDDPQNYTRFLILAREPLTGVPASKTSIVFTLLNAPGALHRALGVFAARGVDLSKLESRPLRGRPWEYAFYLDVLGDPSGAAGEALAELRTLSHEFRVLGSYPNGLGNGNGGSEKA